MGPQDDRLRVAWFIESAPKLSEECRLSSYCTSLLLPRMADRFEIELFSDDPSSYSGPFAIHHYLTAYSRHREAPFDLFFYQLEDGPRGRVSRMHLGLIPGVVWVHDLYLQDKGPEGLYTSPWERTIAQFKGKETEFIDRLSVPHQLWPRAIREVSLSPVVLFSSQWAFSEFNSFISDRIECYPGAQIAEYLPVPVEGYQPIVPKERADVLKLGFVGSVHVEDRAHKILPAIRDAHCRLELTWLVPRAQLGRANELLKEFVVEDRVKLIPSNKIEDWRETLTHIDVALHARRSPFGHLAPYLQHSLAAGKPVVVCDSAEGSSLPKDLVFSVTPGSFESAELRELLTSLSTSPLKGIGDRGREYVFKVSDADRIADTLTEIFHSSAPLIRECLSRWGDLEKQAAESLLQEVLCLAGAQSDQPKGVAAEQILLPVAQELGWVR